MTVVLDLNSIAQISAARLVDCLVGGTLITAFAELLLRLARRQAAATRFAIWFGALMAIASLALVGTGSWNHSRPLAVCTGTGHAVFTASTHWAMFIFTMWAGIAVIGLVRVGFGLGQLYRLRRSCVPVDLESLDPQVRESLNQHAQKRSVGLGTSERVPAPTAVGLWRPAVVIPVWVMQDLSSAELNQVLLHELAHLRRHDDWTNLAQKIVKALLFFHPAVWWIERNASLEREMACDDAVLAETLDPRAYAECLAHLAENSLVRRSLALAQGALGRVHQVSLRVAQVLDKNRPAAGGRWTAAPLMAAIALASIVCSARVPHIVAFDDGRSGDVVLPLPSPSFVMAADRDFTHGGSMSPTPGIVRVKAVLPKAKYAKPVGAHPAVAKEPVLIAADLDLSEAPVSTVRSGAAAVAVVIQSYEYGLYGHAVYQTTVWRIAWVPASGSSNRIPRKET